MIKIIITTNKIAITKENPIINPTFTPFESYDFSGYIICIFELLDVSLEIKVAF
jgi:hypothetical protein